MIDVHIYGVTPDDRTRAADHKRYRTTLGAMPPGGNPINRAYEYLKTLPEWGGAADV